MKMHTTVQEAGVEPAEIPYSKYGAYANSATPAYTGCLNWHNQQSQKEEK